MPESTTRRLLLRLGTETMQPDTATATRPPRRLAAPELRPQMTAAQRRAQDATVAILRRYADAAEAYLAAHPQRAEPGEQLCPCGIVTRACRCPLRTTR